MPPTDVIEDDSRSGNVETSNVFDPASDGIDFYESLEADARPVNDAVVIGPTNGFGELWVLPDDGSWASLRTARGGIVVRDVGAEPPGDYRSGDFNPERIQLDDAIADTPDANVGDRSRLRPTIGVLNYDFGNYELLLTSAATAVSGGLTREVTTAARPTGAFGGDLQRREPRSARPADEVRRSRKPDREQPQEPGRDRARGGAGQQRPDQRRDDGREPDADDARRGDRRRRRARPTSSGRSIRWTTRTAASRAATSASPSSSARTAASSSSTVPAAARRRRPRSSRGPSGPELTRRAPAASTPRTQRLELEPQAARGRVSLPRREALRHRQPLQLEGRRPAALRPLPAADAHERGAAAPAGTAPERLRRLDPRRRPRTRT